VAVELGEAALGAVPAYETMDLCLAILSLVRRQAGEVKFRRFA
jgi:hypothetical protein